MTTNENRRRRDAERRALEQSLGRCARSLTDAFVSCRWLFAPEPSPQVDTGESQAALSSLLEDAPVAPDLANQLWRTARQLLGPERASDLWAEAGVAPDRLPRARHATRFASRLDLDSLAEGAQ